MKRTERGTDCRASGGKGILLANNASVMGLSTIMQGRRMEMANEEVINIREGRSLLHGGEKREFSCQRRIS